MSNLNQPITENPSEPEIDYVVCGTGKIINEEEQEKERPEPDNESEGKDDESAV